MIPTLSILAVLVMGVAVFRTGRSPLTLLVRTALHAQAVWLWISRYAWPAVMRERRWYGECLHEAHRRIVEVRPVERKPVAEETFSPPPSFKTTVLALDVEAGMVASLTHPDMPSGVGSFRVTGWRLNRDWSIAIEGRPAPLVRGC